MERTTVESSLIKSIGYHGDNSVLEVEFHNGAVYLYDGVPQGVYSEIVSSDSVGKAFNRLVKSEGSYPYKRV